MFLLNSTSVDAGAIIGTCHGTSVGRLRHRGYLQTIDIPNQNILLIE